MHGIQVLLFLLIGSLLAPIVHALGERDATAAIDAFLKAQRLEGGDASPGQHLIADLDGDGRSDIVLQWDLLGPTWSLPKLTVLIAQGGRYRALTTDLTGQIQKIAVKGSIIQIDTLTLGPKDARCCPTRHVRVNDRWADGRLRLAR